MGIADYQRVRKGKFATKMMNMGFGYADVDYENTNLKRIASMITPDWHTYETYCLQMYDYITRDVDVKGMCKTMGPRECQASKFGWLEPDLGEANGFR